MHHSSSIREKQTALSTDLVRNTSLSFLVPHILIAILKTGGALGIGSELVRLLHSHGAHVFFGDVLISQGEALAAELSVASAQQSNQQQIKFLYTNVQDHLANLGLFDLAFDTCGRVDHAVSVAGINREENIVDKELTLESVRKVCFLFLISLPLMRKTLVRREGEA
jgi:NAD(P)-dependent dehydrogenase (short-subunit alcohol dehydrogenase family)